MLDEQQQRIEEPRREVQRAAVAAPDLLLRAIQHEITERIAGLRELGEFSHLSGTLQARRMTFRTVPRIVLTSDRSTAPDPGGKT